MKIVKKKKKTWTQIESKTDTTIEQSKKENWNKEIKLNLKDKNNRIKE